VDLITPIRPFHRFLRFVRHSAPGPRSQLSSATLHGSAVLFFEADTPSGKIHVSAQIRGMTVGPATSWAFV